MSFFLLFLLSVLDAIAPLKSMLWNNLLVSFHVLYFMLNPMDKPFTAWKSYFIMIFTDKSWEITSKWFWCMRTFKNVRGWQFLTLKAAETLYIVCLPPKKHFLKKYLGNWPSKKSHFIRIWPSNLHFYRYFKTVKWFFFRFITR